MKSNDLLNLIEKDMASESAADVLRHRIASEGVDYSFGSGFTERVINRIFSGAIVVNRQLDFVRSMNSIFYRVAFAGVAAIILLLISIFIAEGTISFNSIVGISESFDENLIGLLTDN